MIIVKAIKETIPMGILIKIHLMYLFKIIFILINLRMINILVHRANILKIAAPTLKEDIKTATINIKLISELQIIWIIKNTNMIYKTTNIKNISKVRLNLPQL